MRETTGSLPPTGHEAPTPRQGRPGNIKLQLFTVIYGDSDTYDLELFGSVSSIFANASEPVRVTVFTDRPREPNPYGNARLRIFSAEEFDRITLGGRANHLIKTHAMIEMLQNSTGPVIYFDTDTIFYRDPVELARQLDSHTTLMHASEGTLGDHDGAEEVLQYMERGELALESEITADSPMYNSGIVGMLPTHRHLAERAYEMATTIFSSAPLFLVDQFAMGTQLSDHTKLLTCERDVDHYWGWRRPFVHLELHRLRAAAAAGQLTEAEFREAIHTIRSLPRINAADRVANAVGGTSRTPSSRWLRLCGRCFARSQREGDLDVAQAWALTVASQYAWIDQHEGGVTRSDALWLESFIEAYRDQLTADGCARLAAVLDQSR